jgi:hypothetical protein
MTDDMITTAFDVAVLRAKADEVERNFKLMVAMDSVEWPEKILPTRDDGIQAFSWNYGARELVAEMKRVSQILVLRAKLEKPCDRKDYLSFPMSLQEAFIDSDAKRIELIDRLHIYFNSNWKRDVVSTILERSQQGTKGWTEAIQASYKHAVSIFVMNHENLLLMQALHEELKPETQDLIRRCTNHKQIERSMLAMKQSAAQNKPENSDGFHFKPPCGFDLSMSPDRIGDIPRTQTAV